MACLVRTIPELFAYPYPIGYDVINYYIPVVTNFSTHWNIVAGQFPLYVLILHFINVVSGLDSHATVTIVAILMFGIFAVSLFLVAVRLLKIGVSYSILLIIFVIFQVASLRTTWDLHRDIFGLSTMLLTFYFIYRNNENPKLNVLLIALTLSACTASADAMIGSLFVASLIIYTIISRIMIVFLCTLVATGFFAFAILPNQNIFHQSIEGIPAGLRSSTSNSYIPINLFALFVVLNGFLVPTGIIGFKMLKNNLLKIPLLISIVASFSWVVFPNARSLVADRWIVLCGIFLSIFAAYGFILCVQKIDINSESIRRTIILSIVAAFVIMGSAYIAMPSQRPFFLYGILRNNIEIFVPVTMQVQVSSSQDERDNGNLFSAISWINTHTEANATIIGDKAWRGWMEIQLKDQRTYRFSENLSALIDSLNNKHQHGYLIAYYTQKIPDRNLHLMYSDDRFRIFRAR